MVAVAPQLVAADACFLINFLAVDRMDLLAALAAYKFQVPLEVVAEVVRPVQAQRLSTAIADGTVETQEMIDLAEMASFADNLREQLGRGESACLALATSRGWLLASDERGRFRRLATDRIGSERLMTTLDALDQAIRIGALTGRDARVIAEDLRNNHRFAMTVPARW